MKHLLTLTLIILSSTIFSNPLVTGLEGYEKLTLTSEGYQKQYQRFSPFKKRSNLKYGMVGFSGGVSFLTPTGNSYNNFTTEPSHIFEFLLQYNKLFMGVSGSTPVLKARKNTFQNETNNILIEEGDEINYNWVLFKFGYSAIFKDKFRLTPYIHYGIGDFDSKSIDSEEEIKDDVIYSGLTFGGGIKAQYIIVETKPMNIYNNLIPGTVGINFDAGYNYQFADYSLPFKEHTFYASLGIFVGFSFKNR